MADLRKEIGPSLAKEASLVVDDNLIVDVSTELAFEPLRRLEKKRRPGLSKDASGSYAKTEDEIMDALAEEYGHRAHFRLNFVFLGCFLLFLGIYFSMLYGQLANNEAYKINMATQSILPNTFNSSGVQVFGQLSDVIAWLNYSVISGIWSDPACGNGVCDAPTEIPGGIYPGRGCGVDCGTITDVTVHVTLLGTTAQLAAANSSFLQMCWVGRSRDTAVPPKLTNYGAPYCLEATKYNQTRSPSEFDLAFDLSSQQDNVTWFFHVPQSDGDYILNLTISERIVRLYGGIEGYYYSNNSLDTWWVSSSPKGSVAINSRIGVRPANASGSINPCPDGTSPLSTQQSTPALWPHVDGAQPQGYMLYCVGTLGSAASFVTVNPTKIYRGLLYSNPRSMGGSNKQANRVVIGVLLHLTRRPYNHKQCGKFQHIYDRYNDNSTHSYPIRFGSLSPWCPHEVLTPTVPFGLDPHFQNTSRLFNSTARWQDYYKPSEVLEGMPYGFFNTTRSFHTPDDGKEAFFVLFDVNLDVAQAQDFLTYLMDGGFLDMNSHLLVVRVLVYNGIYKLFSELKMEVLMDDSGAISYEYRIDAVSVAQTTSTVVLFSLFLAGVIVLVGWEAMVLYDISKQGFLKALHCIKKRVLQITTNCLFLVAVILWPLIQIKIRGFKPEPRYSVYRNPLPGYIPMLQLTPPPDNGDPSQADLMHGQFRKFEGIVQLRKYYVFFGSVNTVFVLWRALQLSHFHPRLGILTRTLSNIVPDIMAYFFVWVIVTFGYAVMGMITFGGQLTQFHTFSQAFNSMVTLYLGTIDVNTSLISIATTVWDQIPSRIFFWSYMIIANLVLLNFLIAIVIDMFSDVKRKNVIRERLVNRMSSEAAFTLGSWKYTKAAYLFRLLVSDYEERTKKYYLSRHKRFMSSPLFLVGHLLTCAGFSLVGTWRTGTIRHHTKDVVDNDQVEMGQSPSFVKRSLMQDVGINNYDDDEKNDSEGYGDPSAAASDDQPDIVHTRKFRNYKYKALIVDGVEIQNSYLASIFAARLTKITGVPHSVDGVRWLVSYVLACYGGESASQKGFYEDDSHLSEKRSDPLGSLAQEIKGEISDAICKETEGVTTMLNTLQANIKNNMATLQEQLDLIAEDVYTGSYNGNSQHFSGQLPLPGDFQAKSRSSSMNSGLIDPVDFSANPTLAERGHYQTGPSSSSGLGLQDRRVMTQVPEGRAAELHKARRRRLGTVEAFDRIPDVAEASAHPHPSVARSALPPGFAAQPIHSKDSDDEEDR